MPLRLWDEEQSDESSSPGSPSSDQSNSSKSDTCASSKDSSSFKVQVQSTSSESQRSDSEKSSASSSTDEQKQMEKKLKGQQQTAKARAACIAARARRRMAKNAVLDLPPHPASSYREHVRSNNTLTQPAQSHVNVRKRTRLLASYLKAWATAIMNCLRSYSGDLPQNATVTHALTTCVVDDTNVRLASPIPDVPQWKMSRVLSIMQLVQNMFVYFCPNAQGDQGSEMHYPYHTFPVHTPFACLAKTDKVGLAAEFRSRLISFLGAVPDRFRSVGLPAELLQDVPIQALCICFDSLVTNLAVLKKFRSSICSEHDKMKQQQQQQTTQPGEASSGRLQKMYPLVYFCCAIHQLALARKPLLLGIPQFWSSITRLTHLFEVHSFRVHLRGAIVAVICSSFSYIPVATLPAQAEEWKEIRRECCGMVTDQATGYNKKRLELHQQLLKYDNGDIEEPTFTHFCTGSCCTGETHEEKAAFAQLQIVRYYLLLFSFGCPVPLLYRWKHAHRALRYCREPRICYVMCHVSVCSSCI